MRSSSAAWLTPLVLPLLALVVLALARTTVVPASPDANLVVHVSADQPFVVSDAYARCLCVSDAPGWVLPPLILADHPVLGIGPPPVWVPPWQPFLVHSPDSTQICVTTVGGYVLTPLLVSTNPNS